MGPLAGLRIVEIAGIGPGPYCAMLLADMGAEVLRVERVANVRREGDARFDLLSRGRRCIAVDLKHRAGVDVVLRLVARADGLTEGFRPGVMERLGLGPDECLAVNPSLVYGRMTGFGQTGPLAQAAGHDINYISLAGALAPIGRRGAAPTPPLNLVGDFGGGGLLLAFGMTCALLERARSGKGQVVDAAMVDGAAALMTVFHGAQQSGWWSEQRGSNMLDTGSHFYDAYETADGEFVSIGAIEPQFYAELLKRMGIDAESLPSQMDRAHWPRAKQAITRAFKTKTRAEWCAILEGSDACFAPVLTMSEARRHPHNVERGVFVDVQGVSQPRPAPRFSRTDSEIQRPPARPGEHTDEALGDWGFSAEEIESLRASKAIA
jgi:alpha-methylacyl-CoA racemase